MRCPMLLFFTLLACQDTNQSPKNTEPKEQVSENKSEKAEKKNNVEVQESECTYTVTQAKPEWTAYKYTEKAAVGGTFNAYKLSPTKPASSFTGALQNLSIEIDAASVESNNPARNTTIAEKYFALFAPQSIIKGNVLSAKGDEKKGTVEINIDMNGVQKPYTFSYEEKEGMLVASSVMDMMDFQLQKPFDSIHTACKELHTGSDGVAKTWTEVALRVVVQYDKQCK